MPTQTEVTPRPGNMGAVIDETERAAADIEKILNRISDAQYERIIRALLAMGIDGLYSDHVDRMMSAVHEFER